MARLLGIDPGTRRIGVALSDPSAKIASPAGIIEATGGEEDVAAIIRIAREHDVEEIVIGHPIKLDGTRGPAAEEAERLAGQVRAASGLPVRLWDERLTSVQAERAMIAGGMRRRARRAAADRTAAAIMLQSYLDARGRSA